jgi:hypothetical protein
MSIEHGTNLGEIEVATHRDQHRRFLRRGVCGIPSGRRDDQPVDVVLELNARNRAGRFPSCQGARRNGANFGATGGCRGATASER